MLVVGRGPRRDRLCQKKSGRRREAGAADDQTRTPPGHAEMTDHESKVCVFLELILDRLSRIGNALDRAVPERPLRPEQAPRDDAVTQVTAHMRAQWEAEEAQRASRHERIAAERSR